MKGLKYLLVIVGPIVLLFGLYKTFLSGGTGIADRVTLVNVLTGDVRVVAERSIKALPVEDEQGQASLFPVYKDESGDMFIVEVYREGLLDAFGNNASLKVDPATFRVIR